jgi:hypothetical protein
MKQHKIHTKPTQQQQQKNALPFPTTSPCTPQTECTLKASIKKLDGIKKKS